MRPNAIVATVLALSACIARESSAIPIKIATYPNTIVLGGVGAWYRPDPANVWVCRVHDAGGNPLNGLFVEIDFSGCPDVVMATGDSACTVNLANKTIGSYTDINGFARIAAAGYVGSRWPAGRGLARVYAGGVQVGTVNAAALDQDGVDGVGPNDLALLLSDIASGQNPGRSDLNGDGLVDNADAAILLEAMGSEYEAASVLHEDHSPIVTPVVSDGGARLAWADCPGTGGTSARAFACSSTGGEDWLYATMLAPPGLVGVTGAEVVIDLVGDVGSALPDFWRMSGAGSCNQGRASAGVGASTGCMAPWALSPYCGITSIEYAFGGQSNVARIRIDLGSADPAPATPVAGAEYQVTGLRLSHAGSTGACAGCSAPVAIVLQSIRLTQGTWGSPVHAGPDYLLQSPTGPNIAYWQGVPVGFNAPTPARNTTWGRLKRLYR